MKKADIVMIVLIASVSILIAFFVGKAVFGDVYKGNAKIQTIDQIDSTVVAPDAEIFNSDAINPSVQVQINGTN